MTLTYVRRRQNPLFDVAMFEKLIEEFETRDDDVFVCTYVKAGTTWCQQIVTLLLNGGEQGEKTYGERVPWLEALCAPDTHYRSSAYARFHVGAKHKSSLSRELMRLSPQGTRASSYVDSSDGPLQAREARGARLGPGQGGRVRTAALFQNARDPRRPAARKGTRPQGLERRLRIQIMKGGVVSLSRLRRLRIPIPYEEGPSIVFCARRRRGERVRSRIFFSPKNQDTRGYISAEVGRYRDEEEGCALR